MHEPVLKPQNAHESEVEKIIPIYEVFRLTPDLRENKLQMSSNKHHRYRNEKFLAKDAASNILLVPMLWLVSRLIIDVDISSLDIREIL